MNQALRSGFAVHLSSMGQAMKTITAIIKPFGLDDVREAVAAIGIQGITLTEIK